MQNVSLSCSGNYKMGEIVIWNGLPSIPVSPLSLNEWVSDSQANLLQMIPFQECYPARILFNQSVSQIIIKLLFIIVVGYY